jgi:hypothetical protein
MLLRTEFHHQEIPQILPGFCQRRGFPAEDKKEEVMFMNRSVNYFAKNDQFERAISSMKFWTIPI